MFNWFLYFKIKRPDQIGTMILYPGNNLAHYKTISVQTKITDKLRILDWTGPNSDSGQDCSGLVLVDPGPDESLLYKESNFFYNIL